MCERTCRIMPDPGPVLTHGGHTGNILALIIKP